MINLINMDKDNKNTEDAVMCSFFKREVRYRHGTCYKLFYGRIYCITVDM